jgi:hypothetical protein
MFKKWRVAVSAAAVLCLALGGVAVTGAAPAFAGVCTTSAVQGACPNSTTVPYVNNNIWNKAASCIDYVAPSCENQGTQTLTETSPGDWSVSSDLDGLVGNGVNPDTYAQVISYPETVYNLGTVKPVEGSGALPGIIGYGETEMPSDLGTAGSADRYETAWDIWLNGRPGDEPNGDEQEVMIWTDNENQYPGGGLQSSTNLWTDPITGCTYKPYGSSQYSVESLVVTSSCAGDDGYVDIQSALEWLAQQKYIAALTSTSNELFGVDYGMEIVNTSGKAETFSVDGYGQYWIGYPTSINANIADGGAEQTASWPAVSGATSYKYALFDGDSGNLDAGWDSTTSTSAVIKIAEGNYYWEVQACGAEGCGPIENEWGVQAP